ncbi:PTS sugar transporter subunit IIC, partial [Salmonella enterica subsp. enterica serovar Typhi]|nr:PTS sugar transporter subunit IIC [Salmonella enterica subsp. enterica serovar Typhi]
KRLMPFFFLGFFLVAYLNLGIMAIAVFAVIAAVIMNINAEQKVSATKG